MRPPIAQLRGRAVRNLTCQGKLFLVPFDGPAVQVWAGPCLIYPADRDARVVEVGGASVPLSRYVLLLPHDAPVKVGQMFTITRAPHARYLEDHPGWRVADAPVDAWGVLRECVATT